MQKCVICWLDVHTTGESKVELESKTLLVRDRWLLCSLWKIFPYVYRVNDSGAGSGPALLQQVTHIISSIPTFSSRITICNRMILSQALYLLRVAQTQLDSFANWISHREEWKWAHLYVWFPMSKTFERQLAISFRLLLSNYATVLPTLPWQHLHLMFPSIHNERTGCSPLERSQLPPHYTLKKSTPENKFGGE